MSNFHALEIDVIRWAEANGKLSSQQPDHIKSDLAQDHMLEAVSTVYDLCDAVRDGRPVEISDAMGRVAIDMITLCAMLDIDLSKCLDQAFNKIKAKPSHGQNQG